jgi:serine/threonine-protein kinase
MSIPYSAEWEREVAENMKRRVKEGMERWNEIINKLFPVSVPKSMEWSTVKDISVVLNLIGQVPNTNHIFCPDGGGFDLTGSAISVESGCIELKSDGSTTIIKPRRLTFHAINSDPNWHYFYLETNTLSPSGVYDYDDTDSLIQRTSEEVCELAPGDYVERSIWDYGYFGSDENGDPLPLSNSARPIIREFTGSFAVFGKYSYYNQDNSTYDGRHNKLGPIGFDQYIKRQAGVAPNL